MRKGEEKIRQKEQQVQWLRGLEMSSKNSRIRKKASTAGFKGGRVSSDAAENRSVFVL